jgi:hypothetical protein
MKTNDTSQEPRTGQSFPLVERVAAAVLLLVLVVIGWIVVAAHRPRWLRFVSIELEVLFVIGLLTAALLLVAFVALRHTRD